MSRDLGRRPGYVLLEDGSRFEGILLGQAVPTAGEVVFTTAMTGYQEAVTDPSYAGQILTFTYPMIGNYGVREDAGESDRVHAEAVIVREARDAVDSSWAETGLLDWLGRHRTPAIAGVDTRSLVRHIRTQGSMRGGLFEASADERAARETLDLHPPMSGRNLASGVSPAEPTELDPLRGEPEGAPHVVALDTGIKRSIIQQFRLRGARVTLLPCDSPASEVTVRDPDLIFLANGPGDPAALDHVAETVRSLLGEAPLVGICLGHQLLCRAVGLETFKLPFGHRGSNHPVKDLQTGRVEITSQNHGFAVTGPDGRRRVDDGGQLDLDTPFGKASVSHFNLYDGTVEGLDIPGARAATVQYHPEAGPGPRDSRHLFDRFLEMAGRV